VRTLSASVCVSAASLLAPSDEFRVGRLVARFRWVDAYRSRMTSPLLTEGDLDRGHAPDVISPYWRCVVVDPTTGAVCTRRPHGDMQHCGCQVVHGTGWSNRLVLWTAEPSGLGLDG
jgi:hypothetical protein